MRGEDVGGFRGGANRRRIHSSGKPQRKSSRKKKGGNGLKVTCSRSNGETARADDQGFVDSGTDIGTVQVGI